jgi:acyl carrier protein
MSANSSIRVDILARARDLLRDSLQIGARAAELRDHSPLLGAIPELDSMAVVTLLTAVEDEFAVVIDDDEVSADVFATLGSFAAFIERKLSLESG